jgi:hypothetical protein
MAVTAQAGIVGWGPQIGKGTIATVFHKHKATTIDLGMLDDVRMGALEIGGSPFPTFPYKAGYSIGGGFEIQPRMEDVLGWLLYSLMGDCSSAVVGTTDAYKHTFKPLAADTSAVKWMTLKKYIPKKDNNNSTDLGEIFTDCKPVAMTLDLAAEQPLSARMDFIGRTWTPVADTTAWTWANAAYEDWHSIPVGCEVGGFVKFTGGGLSDFVLPAVAARVTMVNQNLPLPQEKVIGSFGLEDVTIVTRQMAFDITVKWNDPELLLAIQGGANNATGWTSTPLVGELFLTAATATEIPDDSGENYRMEVEATNVVFQLNGPPVLAAGRAVMLRFMGTVMEPNSGAYAEVRVVNAKTAYTWPS